MLPDAQQGKRLSTPLRGRFYLAFMSFLAHEQLDEKTKSTDGSTEKGTSALHVKQRNHSGDLHTAHATRKGTAEEGPGGR